MNQYDIRRLALVLSIQAEIEGMKIENICRVNNGLSPAYGEDAFQNKAFELDCLARKHDDQL